MKHRFYAGIIIVVGITTLIIGYNLLSKPTTQDNPLDIEVDIIPKTMNSCPGHTAWLLVNITGIEDPNEDLSVSIQTDQPMESDYVLWSNPIPQVLEVFLYPNSSHVNSDIDVEVQVRVDSEVAMDKATLHVVEWEIFDMSHNMEFFAPLLNYLELNHPELGINDSISWTILLNAPQILIVEHYLFMSESWEVELSRHVMIAPHDWVQVTLRPRGAINPTWSGKVESWSTDNQLILEMDPPDHIYR